MVSREYPPCPLVGVGVFVFRGDACLVAKRAHDPGKGDWSIPGGRVELGETLEEAARRELAEECGPDLRVDLRGVALVLDRIVRAPDDRPRFHYVLLDFVTDYLSGEPVAGTDALEVRWATADELAAMKTSGGLAEIVRELVRRRASGSLEPSLASWWPARGETERR